MGTESFDAIFDDFLKRTASALYQLALGAGFQAESEAPEVAVAAVNDPAPAPAPKKRELTVEEADAVLIKMARRTKQPHQSNEFVSNARRKLGWSAMQIRGRIAELEASGAIPRKDIE
jgi:hypothetical protein